MDTASTVSMPDDTQEMETAFVRLIAQIDDIREQMKADDIAIAQSNAEYEALKAEGLILREDTRSIMANVEKILVCRRLDDSEERDRKMMGLQLENELLKFERRLPSGKPNAGEREE